MFLFLIPIDGKMTRAQARMMVDNDPAGRGAFKRCVGLKVARSTMEAARRPTLPYKDWKGES